MALSRRTGQRFQGSIWPGFVDAMTGLLLVLMFVLTMFMVMQFVLRETITGQESELDDLSQEISALAEALGLERDRTQRLESDLGALNATLDDVNERALTQSALIAALQQQRDEQAATIADAQAQITSFEAQVASLLSQRDDALGNVAALESAQADLLDEKQALELALATARSEIDDRVEAARLAAAQREAMEALIADLRQEGADKDAALTARAADLAELQEALSAEEQARLLEAEAVKALRARLENADAELTAMTLALEAQRKEAEETLTLLAAARSASEDLTTQLAAAVTAGQDADVAKAAVEEELAEVLAQLALARSDLANAREQQAQTALVNSASEAENAAKIAAMLAAQDSADAMLTELTLELETSAQLIAALTDELARTRDALAKSDAALTIAQDDSEIELSLAAALAARTAAELEREEVQRQLAAALAAKLAAQQQAEVRLDAATQQAILLAAAREELAAEQSRASDAQRQTEALNQQVAALRSQLSSLQAILDEAKVQDEAAKVQLQNLGSELNSALARVAAEERKRRELEEAERLRLEAEAKALAEQTKDLERYRSEFFGRLRDVLGAQEGVRIEGDRFVFSSEVLFPPGRANLSNEGRGEVAKVATILRAIADDIPSEIDWVIRVDGHTDNVPLSGTGEFADNWELSQGRALSVVKYMVNFLGIPPDRLAANGFGQYQPVNLEDSDEARAQNRRIELKFTEK